MTVFQKPRDHPIAEHMFPPELGHVIIQAHQIRQAAAQDDGIGVENIDDLPQRARHRITWHEPVAAPGAIYGVRRFNRLIEIENIAQQRFFGRVNEARVDGVHKGQQRFVTRAVAQ